MDYEKKLTDHEDRIKKLEQLLPMSVNTIISQNKIISLKEFMLEKNPKTDVEKTMLIGYFFEQNKGQQEWTSKDIQGGFKLAKESTPGNVSDKIQKGIKRGLIIAGNKKGYYKLTNSGDKIVGAGFDKK